MKLRGALYARVSTPHQAEADLSIPDQIKALTAYCDRNEIEIIDTYIDAGLSGTDDNRPQFQKMIDAAEYGRRYDILLAHSYSRLMRNNLLLELYKLRLEKVDVEIRSITQEFGNNPLGDLMRQIVGIFDEYHSKETAKHVKRTMRANAEAGFVNGPLPYGFKAVVVEMRGTKAKKRAVHNEDEMEVVRLMFKLAHDGLFGEAIGLKEIAKELKKRNKRNRNGKYFSKKAIHDILHDTAYIGCLIYGKVDGRTRKVRHPSEWITIAVLPSIEETTFETVHAMMRERDPMRVSKRLPPRPTLLSGLPYCSTCDHLMGGVTGTGKMGVVYSYYKCTKQERFSDGGCNEPQIIRRDLLETLIVDHLADVTFEPGRLRLLLEQAIEAEQSEQDEAPRQLERLVRDKTDLDNRISRLYQAIELGNIDMHDPELAGRISDLRGTRGQVESQIAALRSVRLQYPALTDTRLQEFSAALRRSLRDGDVRLRRGYLRFFLARIVVHKREIKLEGHKTRLAKAYVRGLQEVPAAASRRAARVHPQVGEWWSRGGSNP